MFILGLVVVSFILSFVLTFYYRDFALEKGIIDTPNERSLHQMPVPRGGGIVFVGIFYVLLLALCFTKQIKTDIFYAFLGGIPVAIIGYLDDIRGVKIQWRLLVHLVAAVWGIVMLGLPHSIFSIIPILLTAWFINFYNFMDGIDGIAATQGIFVTLVAGIFLSLTHHIGLSALCLGMFAALIGFLYWNWEPAKIFMGDVGSGFLGYFFAILMFSTALQYKIPAIFWLFLMIVFLADATLTLLYRMHQKKKWYLAHREHVYQRMVQWGLRHSEVVFALMTSNFIIVLPMSLCFLYLQSVAVKCVFIAFCFVLVSFSWLWLHNKFPAKASHDKIQ